MVKEKKIAPYTWPYDHGVRKNLRSFFGHGPAEWFLYSLPREDGFSYSWWSKKDD